MTIEPAGAETGVVVLLAGTVVVGFGAAVVAGAADVEGEAVVGGVVGEAVV
jgi:hypothetical protein